MLKTWTQATKTRRLPETYKKGAPIVKNRGVRNQIKSINF